MAISPTFNAPGCYFTTAIDEELLAAIKGLLLPSTSKSRHCRTRSRSRYRRSTLLPPQNGWRGKVVTSVTAFYRITITCVSAPASGRRSTKWGVAWLSLRVAILSHRLNPQAPAGYNPNAHVFDEEVVDALRSNEPQRIVEIDFNLRRLAGECGYRSMLVAIGASSELPLSCEVLSYEAPFGVGYLVAQITNQSVSSSRRKIIPPALRT